MIIALLRQLGEALSAGSPDRPVASLRQLGEASRPRCRGMLVALLQGLGSNPRLGALPAEFRWLGEHSTTKRGTASCQSLASADIDCFSEFREQQPGLKKNTEIGDRRPLEDKN